MVLSRSLGVSRREMTRSICWLCWHTHQPNSIPLYCAKDAMLLQSVGSIPCMPGLLIVSLVVPGSGCRVLLLL